MSSQKGNVSRNRKQKYQNKKAFKNDLHDKTPKIKMINNLTAEGICQRCKDIIDWKIKYKKYKPLSQPATCVRCHQKSVKRAYYTVCQPCATAAGVCAKCNTKQEIAIEPTPTQQEMNAQEKELQFELKQLKERDRRTYLRRVERGDTESAVAWIEGKGQPEDEFDFDDFDDDDDDENGGESDEHEIDGDDDLVEDLNKCKVSVR